MDEYGICAYLGVIMKYRLMGIEKISDDIGVKLRLIGMLNGIIVRYEYYPGNKTFTLQGLLLCIVSLTKIKEVDIYIPEHIKNTLKQKE